MRNEQTRKFSVQDRTVTVKVMDTIGVEDAYDILFRGVLHRFATGEDAVRPVPREAKDWMIKLNLTI